MNHEADTTSGWVLHISHCAGTPVDLRWAWPADLTQCDLAQVLSNLDLAAPDRDDMAHGHFELSTGPGPQALAWQHACRVLRCSLNARVLPAGQRVWLQEGDVLEVGLCRMVLQHGAERVAPAQALLPVELTALAAPGMDAGAAPDALDDLLRSSRWADELVQAQASAEVPPLDADTPLSQLAPAEATPPMDALVRDAPEHALQAWHSLYLRRLQAPQEVGTDTAWSGMAQRQEQAGGDPLDALMRQAGERGALSDLLGESVHISTVLAQLDASSGSDVLAPDAPVNVLHLFAPEGWQAPDLNERVPVLNRQEHHGIALDSALPLSEAQTQPEKKSTS